MNQHVQMTRERPLVPPESALLFVDVQNYCAHPDGADFKHLTKSQVAEKYGYFFKKLEAEVIPNMRRLQQAFRSAKIEVMYATIESLTLDGRDRSLDYKISGFHVPKGSWDGKVLDAIRPIGDEIVLTKTSSSVFISTHIDYILRNLGVKQLVISGFITDQCVESAVRDACDLGYLVSLVTDACATYTQDRHDMSLNEIKGYCRQITTADLISELSLVSSTS